MNWRFEGKERFEQGQHSILIVWILKGLLLALYSRAQSCLNTTLEIGAQRVS